ncbi:hypothetical protein [Streptomyces sp. NPDC018045]|uniref:hypothetical protein n=1 Tax=Streptomyces sp. NPDC018045 TaxID=3365037 RepID=UPI0037ABA6F9
MSKRKTLIEPAMILFLVIAAFAGGFSFGGYVQHEDDARKLAPVISRNEDECFIRENFPGIPDAPEWCND